MHPTRTTWALLALPLLGCPGTTEQPADDDDSVVVTDDDDATEPPDPLADVVGSFTLGRTVVDGDEAGAWVDLSGGFGTFAAVETDTVSVGAYFGTFNFGVDVPFWRWDLGAWSVPAVGEAELINLLDYLPWTPGQETWWDGGARVGLGNYLTLRADLDDVTGYQVDDPLSPGNSAWTPGASLGWENEGGAEVVAWSAPESVALPGPAQLVSPATGAVVPSALDLTVQWTPRDDGATVTVGVLRDLGFAWIAQEDDDGEATIPGDALHDGFGEGIVEVFVARTIRTELAHPQGTIVVRTRDEQRATVGLLPDVVIDPPFAGPGEVVTVDARWYTGTFDSETTASFGDGVTVSSITPGGDPHAASIELQVDPGAELGGRTVQFTSAADSIEAPDAFAVLNLPPQDACADADAGAPLEPGDYASSTVGLSNDLSSGYACVEWTLNGADALYAVELDAGETLTAELWMAEPGDGALALLSSCDAATAVACADEGFEGDPELINYRADVAGTYYLAVDAYHFADAGTAFSAPFDLFVSTSTERLAPAWLQPGDSALFTLTGDAAWTPGLTPADLDPDDDVVVEALSASADPLVLDLRLAAAPNADPGPRTLEIAADAFVAEDALWITDLPVFDSCADASAADGVEPGTYIAFAPGTTSTVESPGACLAYDLPGPDLFVPLDLLTGQLLSVEATDGIDLALYLLPDCAAEPDCLIAVDDGFDGDTEIIEDFEVPADGRYYLGVDNYIAGAGGVWGYTLDIGVQ